MEVFTAVLAGRLTDLLAGFTAFALVPSLPSSHQFQSPRSKSNPSLWAEGHRKILILA